MVEEVFDTIAIGKLFGLDFIEFGFHRKYFLDSIWTHLTSLDVSDFSTMDRA